MMKGKDTFNFWAGFLIMAGLTAWLYWLWQQRREVTPRPLVVSARQPAAALPPKAKTPTAEADDLTVIKGIGPVFAARLNKAGIFSYAQLAGETAERVQAVSQVTRWDPADWIAEAKNLAS